LLKLSETLAFVVCFLFLSLSVYHQKHIRLFSRVHIASVITLYFIFDATLAFVFISASPSYLFADQVANALVYL